MRPCFESDALRETAAWQHVLRFAFGGAVTVGTGLVAQHWGPVIGGLFLAFPAILPASLASVDRHDGRADAIDDARGARLGAIALVVFACVVSALSEHWAPPAVLGAAALAWLGVSLWTWNLVYGGRGGRHADQHRAPRVPV